jgi:hypothetical protein
MKFPKWPKTVAKLRIMRYWIQPWQDV